MFKQSNMTINFYKAKKLLPKFGVTLTDFMVAWPFLNFG